METSFVFYWFAWICWVWITFFMDKSSHRTQWTVILLLAIWSAGQHIILFGFYIHLSLLFFLGLGLYLLCSKPFYDVVYLCFSSFVIALGYSALYLMSVYDPVWLMISFQWVSTAFFMILCLLLLSTFLDRLLCLFISITVGEIVFGLILYELGLFNELGTNGFLVRLTCASVGLLSYSMFERMAAFLENYIVKLNKDRKNVL